MSSSFSSLKATIISDVSVNFGQSAAANFSISPPTLISPMKAQFIPADISIIPLLPLAPILPIPLQRSLIRDIHTVNSLALGVLISISLGYVIGLDFGCNEIDCSMKNSFKDFSFIHGTTSFFISLVLGFISDYAKNLQQNSISGGWKEKTAKITKNLAVGLGSAVSLVGIYSMTKFSFSVLEASWNIGFVNPMNYQFSSCPFLSFIGK